MDGLNCRKIITSSRAKSLIFVLSFNLTFSHPLMAYLTLSNSLPHLKNPHEMQQYAELVDLLNDLIRINIDRVKELRKRLKDVAKDSQLVPLFKKFIEESYEFKAQLVREVLKKGGEVINKISGNTGRIYHSWIEFKNWLSQKKDVSVLERVKYNTMAALKVYKEAVFMIANIPADALDLIATQKALLRKGCETIEAQLVLQHQSSR